MNQSTTPPAFQLAFFGNSFQLSHTTLAVLAGIAVLCAVSWWIYTRHRDQIMERFHAQCGAKSVDERERFQSQDVASKCFSCERQTGKHYRSNKSKCFDCETELKKNDRNPVDGQPVKCFTCFS